MADMLKETRDMGASVQVSLSESMAQFENDPETQNANWEPPKQYKKLFEGLKNHLYAAGG